MQTNLEMPEPLFNEAKQAAAAQGISVAEFISDAVVEKLHAVQPPNAKKQRVRLPLVRSSRPGAQQLTSERVAEILSEQDVSH